MSYSIKYRKVAFESYYLTDKNSQQTYYIKERDTFLTPPRLKPNWYIDDDLQDNNEFFEIDCNQKKDFKLSLQVLKLGYVVEDNKNDKITTDIIDNISLNVHIVKGPVVTFEKPYTYQGEFGFDGYANDDLIRVQKANYYVPWMSIPTLEEHKIKAPRG